MITLSSLLKSALESKLEGMHTCFPATIVSYDFNQQRASVKPSLKKRLNNDQIETPGIIPNLPVWMPRGGGAAISLPVAVGDIALIICSERSLDEFLYNKNEAPQDPRKFSAFDGVVFVGLSPFPNTPAGDNAEDMLIYCNSAKIRLQPTGDITINATDTLKIDAPNVQIAGNLDVTGTIKADGEMTSGSIKLTEHVHGGVETGGGTTGEPQ